MFERFEDAARRVVVLAQDEARRLDHGSIGTEHLLLGLLAQDRPMADALGELGVTLEAARDEVEDVVGPDAGPARAYLPFTPRAKAVLELSLREALRLEHTTIRPEHILLGLVGEREGVACQVLVRLGCDLDVVRAVAEASARDDVARSQGGGGPAIDLPEAAAVVAALVAAFGDRAQLVALQAGRSGGVQAVVRVPGQSRSTVVELVRTGDGWTVGDRPGSGS